MDSVGIPTVAALGRPFTQARPSEGSDAPAPREGAPASAARADATQVEPKAVRRFERSVGPARDGSGVIVDLLIPPVGVQFARLFGADDQPRAINVKA